jgi:hypothetical protein
MSIVESFNELEVDFEKMELVCGTREDYFMDLVKEVYPHAVLYEPTDGRQLIYVDNKSPLLSVCHLDGTMPATHFYYGNHYGSNDMRVFSPFVDDRIGAYIQLHIYPQLGITPDLLFTVGEESGESTAQFFNAQKDYNWMFEFDRMGDDVVHYQYTLAPWLDALDKHFLSVSRGAWSDIGHLDHLGCQGVNIGCGYYNYTRPDGWCSMDIMTAQCQRFKNFYDEFKDTPFRHPRDFYLARRRRYSIIDDADEVQSKEDIDPKFRRRKARPLKIKHVSKEEIDKEIAAWNAKNSANTVKRTTEDKVMRTLVNTRERVIETELIEVEEPIKELVPEPPKLLQA